MGGEERAPSLPHRNADPVSLEACLQLRSPAVGAEAEQGEERPATLSLPGSRACGDSGGAFRRPQPTSSRTGRAGRGGRGLPGAPTPGPQPRDSGALPEAGGPHLPPRPPPLRPLRSTASSPRDSQLQPLVGRRRHRAPLTPSSSFRPPRPAPPPRPPRYRSPSSAAAAPGSSHPSLHPTRPRADGRRPGTTLARALERAKEAVRRADWSAPKSAVT